MSSQVLSVFDRLHPGGPTSKLSCRGILCVCTHHRTASEGPYSVAASSPVEESQHLVEPSIDPAAR
jgi:hypothetical protein